MLLLGDKLKISSPVMRRAIACPKKMTNKTNDKPTNLHIMQRKLQLLHVKKCRAMSHNKMSYKGKTRIDMSIRKCVNKIRKGKRF